MGKNAGAEWKSGTFIASTHFALATGPVADQADNFPMFADIALQNTVAATIRTLLGGTGSFRPFGAGSSSSKMRPPHPKTF